MAKFDPAEPGLPGEGRANVIFLGLFPAKSLQPMFSKERRSPSDCRTVRKWAAPVIDSGSGRRRQPTLQVKSHCAPISVNFCDGFLAGLTLA